MAQARAGAPTYAVEPDFASRQAVIWSIVWLLGAVTLELVSRILLVLPDLSFGLAPLSYGRLRAAADTLLVFGWLGTATFAAVFILLPRLGEVQLHNEVLGAATVLFWSLVLAAGVGTLLAGYNTGQPLAELPGPVDLVMFLAMTLVLYNAGVTAVRRREKTLYPSVWYLLAAVVLLPVVFAVGNLPFMDGITDAIVSGFYVNGLTFLWLLPVALAVAHYVVPVETGNPLASPHLAKVTFWSLILAGGWAGGRVYTGAALPDYVEAIGIAMTFVVAVPVLSAASNLFATGRGRWDLLGRAFGLRWVAAGTGLLVVWTALVIGSTVPHLSELVGLTAWQAGLDHLAFYGVFSAFAFGLIYRSYPLLIGRAWYSEKLASFHFWTTTVGVGAGALLLLMQGLVQGTVASTWARATDGGLADMIQWFVLSGHGFSILGAGAFGAVVVAQFVFAWNAYRTAQQGPLVQVVYQAQETAGSSA